MAAAPMLEPAPLDQQQQQGDDDADNGDGTSVRSCRYLLPMHAGWFSFNQVHSHEKKALPEYTNNSTPGYTLKVGG